MNRLNKPTAVPLTVHRDGEPQAVVVHAWPYSRSVVVALGACDGDQALHDFWTPERLAEQIHAVAGVNDADGQPLPATPEVWSAALWDAVYGDWPELYVAAVAASRAATEEAARKNSVPSSAGTTAAPPPSAATA